MMRLFKLGICAVLVAAAFVVPAQAKKTQTLLYPTKLNLHFASDNGKTKTVSQTINIEAGAGCISVTDMLGIATGLIHQRPDLAGMKFTGGECPAGVAQAKAMKPGIPAPETVVGAPAVIVLRFQAPDGRIRTATIGAQKPAYYYMGSCPGILRQKEQQLVGQVSPDFPQQRYVGGSCQPAASSINSH